MENKVLEILQQFPLAKSLMIDNEPSFFYPNLNILHKKMGYLYSEKKKGHTLN